MAVKSADKKPEKYIGPDGKPKVRMVSVDKEVVKSEGANATKALQHHAQGMKDARADMKVAKTSSDMTKAMNKLQFHTKAHKKATAAMGEAKDGDGVNIVKDRPFKGKPMKKEPDSGKGIKYSDMKPGKRPINNEEVELEENMVASLAKDFEKRVKSKGYSSRTQDRERMATFAMAKKRGATAADMKKLDAAIVKIINKLDEAYNEPQGQAKRMMSPLQKMRMDKEKADRDREGKLKPGVIKKKAKVDELSMSLKDIKKTGLNKAASGNKEKLKKDLAKLKKNLGETKVDEVLDRPGALDSYRKKAKMKSDKARNTATAKLVRGNPNISKEKETIRKREKGQDMADRAANRHFRKSLGLGYNSKKESVEYVNEKLKVSDGMGAWVDDFKKSDAPQFKGKSEKERRDMAIAAYLSAKRGDK
jgi:hypothetical protein